MLKSNFFLILIFLLSLCCCKEEETPIADSPPSLPESKFELISDGENLFEFSYSACERIPSAIEAIGTGFQYLIYSPGIFHAKDLVNIPDDLDFYFIFHDYTRDLNISSSDSFMNYLEDNQHEFNQPPYEKDFFLKIRKDDKIYQNWWNGDLLAGFGQNISQDETGLELKNVQIEPFEEFSEICFLNFDNVLRLQGNIEGYLITEDRIDSLEITGSLDVFFHLGF